MNKWKVQSEVKIATMIPGTKKSKDELAIVVRVLLGSSIVISDRSDDSSIIVMKSLISDDSTKQNAWGITTYRSDCYYSIPRTRAVSICPQ